MGKKKMGMGALSCQPCPILKLDEIEYVNQSLAIYYNITILSIYRFSSLYYYYLYPSLTNQQKSCFFKIIFISLPNFISPQHKITQYSPLHTYNIIYGFGCSD